VRFEIENASDPAAEIRRVLLEQITHGREALAGGASEEGVHEARKACKRSRATVALARSGIGSAAARRIDHVFRAAARTIGPVRDSDVLKGLVATFDLGLTVGAPTDRERCARDALAVLATAETLVTDLDLSQITPETFATDIARSYAKARSALQVADKSRSAEDLHALRRTTKRWWYQLQLLQPLDKDVFGALASLADALQEQLGDHHDLEVLCGLEGAGAELKRRLEERAGDLEERTIAAASWLYAAPPSTFAAWVGEVVSRR
jgi:CHAD domain-containing protein